MSKSKLGIGQEIFYVWRGYSDTDERGRPIWTYGVSEARVVSFDDETVCVLTSHTFFVEGDLAGAWKAFDIRCPELSPTPTPCPSEQEQP